MLKRYIKRFVFAISMMAALVVAFFGLGNDEDTAGSDSLLSQFGATPAHADFLTGGTGGGGADGSAGCAGCGDSCACGGSCDGASSCDSSGDSGGGTGEDGCGGCCGSDGS